MLPSKKENKELTEQQQKFIDALFGEANGSPKRAGEIAGYSPFSYSKVVKSLKDEILERAEYSLAFNSAKAVKGLVNALDDDGTTPGANIRMEAAKQILDRTGLVKKEKIDITGKMAHGIFILPPKDGTNQA
jgi:hypothetical protein|tara:strand:+ start:327 stop:722 length:396 start_codon:yes stop_codon:yes gene_type:complete